MVLVNSVSAASLTITLKLICCHFRFATLCRTYPCCFFVRIPLHTCLHSVGWSHPGKIIASCFVDLSGIISSFYALCSPFYLFKRPLAATPGYDNRGSYTAPTLTSTLSTSEPSLNGMHVMVALHLNATHEHFVQKSGQVFAR
ncbi:hypothetical protein EDC04DRAFT_2655047 [Pisolithus marmoratus]|nr:hypothetical protein EDC04DRAFT_2655047 [Pisolithus marmoratus]